MMTVKILKLLGLRSVKQQTLLSSSASGFTGSRGSKYCVLQLSMQASTSTAADALSKTPALGASQALASSGLNSCTSAT